jgi:hypothetical protein
MKKRKKFGLPKFAPLYMVEGGEGGEGGGGGGGGGDAAAIAAAVAEATAGLKAKNDELIAASKKSREQLKAWEGLDPARVRSLLDQVENDEVLKLHTEGKHDDAYNKRMEKERSTWQSKIDALSTDAASFKERSEALETQVRDLIIDQQVLTNFMTEKGLETAAPDVVLRAKAAFKIEDGVPIARDSTGQIIRGASGPITIKEWVASLKTSAPHLFPGSAGAGAGGGGKGGGGSSDIEAQMEAAAAAGNMDLYRELRTKKNSGK